MKDKLQDLPLESYTSEESAETKWFSATETHTDKEDILTNSIPARWLALVLMTGIFILFLIVRWFGFSLSIAPWLEALLFLGLGYALMVVALERLIYQKIKTLDEVKQQEIRKLKSLETYRRDFLGEVSHELKTPIFAVQGFIHTLLDGAMEDEKVRVKFLKKAMKNSDRLSNLVEDLLIITQAESGEMEVRLTKFPIYDLIIEVLESLDHKFTRKNRNISYVVNADDMKETRVLADRERIHQVLTNLIDNAIKYGNADGNISIDIEALYPKENKNKLQVSVTDEGPGIEEGHLDKIFRRFYRVDKSRSREKGGTGLGLAICKHLLTVHGENISVKSKLGVGTTFSFTLQCVNE